MWLGTRSALLVWEGSKCVAELAQSSPYTYTTSSMNPGVLSDDPISAQICVCTWEQDVLVASLREAWVWV